MPGWLGSEQTPEDWVQTAHSDATVECHTTKQGQQCAGLGIYRGNVCKKPRNPNTLALPPNEKKVFSTPMEFIAHHRKNGFTSAEVCREEGIGRNKKRKAKAL